MLRQKKLIGVLLVGIVLYFTPAPVGVKTEAWQLFAIFLSTILGIILQVLPMGAVALIGIAAVGFTGVLAPNNAKNGLLLALSGFSNGVIWLVVSAFFIARGFIKTGLGKRIAYHFIKLLGKRSLGLSYGLLAADLTLAPAIPSNTARGGGVIYPILRALAENYHSRPGDGTSRRIGAFLIVSAFQGNIITSAMFLTAMAANPLAAKLASNLGVEITWGGWALAALVPGLISLALVPFFIYKVFPPQVKQTLDAPKLAALELQKLGPIKWRELFMLAVFVLMVVGWIWGKALGVYSTTVALSGLALLLLSNTLTWEEVKNESGAWETLVWFASLVMMATYLNELGFIAWFSEGVQQFVGPFSWKVAFPILIVVYVYAHYFFASATAQVAAMYLAFLAVGISVGVPAMLMALALAFSSNIYAGMTHYGTGPAPVFFGAGYVTLKDWWKLGFYLSVINLLVWLGIGGVWWKLIGIF